MISLGSFSGPPNLCFRSVASIKVVPKPSNPPGSIFTLLKTLDKPIVDPGLKSDWYKFSFCSPESASPEHHIMCAILQLEKIKSKEISQFIHTRQQSQDKIHPEWALTIRIIMLVTIGCKVHLPTTMKLPFFIPLHKCLQHWHLGLLLGMGTVQSSASKTNKCFTSVGAVKAASTLCLARIVEMSFLTFASFFWAFVNLLGITWHKFHISTRVEGRI